MEHILCGREPCALHGPLYSKLGLAPKHYLEGPQIGKQRPNEQRIH